jgi:hypothetical protein
MFYLYTIFNTLLSYFITIEKNPQLLCYKCGKPGHLSTACSTNNRRLMVPLKNYLL